MKMFKEKEKVWKIKLFFVITMVVLGLTFIFLTGYTKKELVKESSSQLLTQKEIKHRIVLSINEEEMK